MEVTSENQADSGAVATEGRELTLMEQFLNDPTLDYKTLKYGDVMDGVIMRVDRDEILVDIGSKSEGVVPSREFSSLSSDERDALAMGETVLVFVVQPENQEGQAVVSIDRARQEKSWRRLQEIFDANDVIEAEVTNYNKGGLLVNLDGVRGFVPASQVSEIRGGDEASKQADMARMIGSSLPLKVIEINRHRNRLILSERQAVQERRDVQKERLIGELKEGEVRQGRVSSICDFGAFVDIGGADGLVHLSELSWSRVRHPSEILRVGQEVEVFVLGINPQERKIALSLKRTQAEPWSQVGDKYEVSQLVRGTITQLANFGAFARIEDGIEGLIHVSELTDERIVHPKQVVKEGDELLLRIIRIDPQRRRMGLSLRRALDTPDADLEAVFGEGVLEERDRIVADLRAALEAEGIEPGSGRGDDDEDGGEQRAESGADGGAATATAEADIPQVDRVAQFQAAMDAQTEQPRQSATRSRGGDRGDRVEIASMTGNAPMSAMEAAFAAAGALNMDATPEEGTAASDIQEDEATSAAPQQASADAGEEELTGSGILGTATSAVESAAETVVEAASSLLGKVIETASHVIDRGTGDDSETSAVAETESAEQAAAATESAADSAPSENVEAVADASEEPTSTDSAATETNSTGEAEPVANTAEEILTEPAGASGEGVAPGAASVEDEDNAAGRSPRKTGDVGGATT